MDDCHGILVGFVHGYRWFFMGCFDGVIMGFLMVKARNATYFCGYKWGDHSIKGGDLN